MKIIENYNNLIAEKYDEATVVGKWSAPKEVNKLLLNFKLIKNNLTVLDLGVGTGQTIKSFAGKNCQIFAVDISDKMLRVVRNKYPKIKTLKFDINNGLKEVSRESLYFDIIIAVGVLEFIKNIKKVIKETYQLLKGNGRFIFTYELLLDKYKFQRSKIQYNAEGYMENPPDIIKFKLYRQSKEDINKLLSSVGYKIIKHYKIKAYLKGSNRIPVYYGVVLVKK
jgi:ubiquinone/menaquinone biosynthesis C-methylase UbiE